MVNPVHFIIPFASTLDAQCQAAIQTLTLPKLMHLLKYAVLMHTNKGDEFDFTPPHQRVIGSAEPIVVTPCHWRVGIDHIRMNNPVDLQLTDSESRTLFSAAAPYFTGDGITLTYDTPLRWLAQEEASSSMIFQDISFASLDRVIGRNVDVWQPQTETSKALRRLQNEIQMLLYTHPVNNAREAHGLLTVNSFWISREVAEQPANGMTVCTSLREPALRGNWSKWAQAWQDTSTKLYEASSLASQSGYGLQLTLCGERHANTYQLRSKRPLSERLKHLISPPPTLHQLLASL